jgi:hypothetical protein
MAALLSRRSGRLHEMKNRASPAMGVPGESCIREADLETA